MKSEKFEDFSDPKNPKGFLRFAHLADCHLGGWKDPKLESLNLQSFIYAIDKCIKEKVDFILIAGDLFDTALPSVDILKTAIAEFRKLNEQKIKCYIIQGSHDYSLSGKSFVDVIESAGLCINVKDGLETPEFVIHGIEGKKGGLEKNNISELKINLNKDSKLKILMLHTTLTEIKPKGMEFVESTDAADLPGGFDYYAAGHIHIVSELNIQGKKIVYPGPLFPNNLQELEELQEGSFYIVETQGKEFKLRKESIKLREILPIAIDLNGKDARICTEHILNEILKNNINDKIIILRLKGVLATGKTSDIDFRRIELALQESFAVLRNTSDLTTPELKLTIKTENKDVNKIEEEIVQEYGKKNLDYADFAKKISELMNALSIEKQEGEAVKTFEARLTGEVSKIINLG